MTDGVLRRHVRPGVSLHPRARREPRSRIRESRVQSAEIARLVDVNERAEARHGYRGGERNRHRCVGRRPRRRELAVAVGDRLLAVAWALAQGTGWLARWRNSSGSPKSPVAAISERRRSTPSGVSRCSRNPVDRGFALPGRSGPPQRDQSPVGVHPSAGSTVLLYLPVGKPRGPVEDLELPLAGAARRRSYWRQADEASAEDEVAHTADRSADATATTSAVAATATSRRRRRWCAPERLRTSSQSAGPGVAGSRRSMLARSSSVTFVPPPGGCEARCARH